MISVHPGPITSESTLDYLDGAVVAAPAASEPQTAPARELIVDHPERSVPDPKTSFAWSPIT